ncbi:hypothetical protein NKH18_31585 [Streptomyces sp. M10(2022)]
MTSGSWPAQSAPLHSTPAGSFGALLLGSADGAAVFFRRRHCPDR